MPKKIKKRDTEVRNYGHTPGVFPNYDIPMPNSMNVKPYRSRDMKKTYGERGGDQQVVIKKTNPEPTTMKSIDPDEMIKRIMKSPRKYSTLS